MQRSVEPENRDEREISGYRYVLDLIHERHYDIPITPNVILQLHRDLYRFLDVSFGGRWKDLDNYIGEMADDGTILRAYFDGIVGRVTKRQILDDNPVMSQRTVERILQKMQAEGYIEKVGAARSTVYRRVG